MGCLPPKHTVTFYVVEGTGSSLSLDVSLIETLARASLNEYVRGSQGTELRE